MIAAYDPLLPGNGESVLFDDGKGAAEYADLGDSNGMTPATDVFADDGDDDECGRDADVAACD